MIFPNREIVAALPAEYPAGTRVKLLKMDDIQAPPIGTLGTVSGIDDTGSGLFVVYGEDIVEKVP